MAGNPVADHVRRARARHLITRLRDMWGEEMPPTPDPVFSILLDAVALDDEGGREGDLIVQGDGFSYETFAHLVRLLPPGVADQLLPPDLLHRLKTTLSGKYTLPDDVRVSMPLFAPSVGAWELDLRSGLVSWDARCAALLDVEQTGAPLAQQLSEATHPDDRDRVETCLTTAFTTGEDYEARFRTRVADGSWAWRVSNGRVVRLPDGGARIVGLLAADT